MKEHLVFRGMVPVEARVGEGRHPKQRHMKDLAKRRSSKVRGHQKHLGSPKTLNEFIWAETQEQAFLAGWSQILMQIIPEPSCESVCCRS